MKAFANLFSQKKNKLIFYTTCGPATTFDPKITGVDGVWFFDDGTTLDAASGVEISKTFTTDGLHRAVFRPASGGLAGITAIDCQNDLISWLEVSRCRALVTFYAGTNSAYGLNLASVPRTVTDLLGSTATTGALPQLPPMILTYRNVSNSNITGSLDQLPASSVTIHLYSSSGITSASIAHLVNIRDLRIYSMGWLTADVDTVIDSMWAARANYTYATPALQIGGTNQPPTGNVTAPVEGADWHQDGTTWIPLTTGAKAYDLAKDVNGEGFKRWSITYTGGSIAP